MLITLKQFHLNSLIMLTRKITFLSVDIDSPPYTLVSSGETQNLFQTLMDVVKVNSEEYNHRAYQIGTIQSLIAAGLAGFIIKI